MPMIFIKSAKKNVPILYVRLLEKNSIEKKRGGKKQRKNPSPVNHKKADLIEFSKKTSYPKSYFK